jgi:hypothetical protein
VGATARLRAFVSGSRPKHLCLGGFCGFSFVAILGLAFLNDRPGYHSLSAHSPRPTRKLYGT